jgi:hypothetical protein
VARLRESDYDGLDDNEQLQAAIRRFTGGRGHRLRCTLAGQPRQHRYRHQGQCPTCIRVGATCRICIPQIQATRSLVSYRHAFGRLLVLRALLDCLKVCSRFEILPLIVHTRTVALMSVMPNFANNHTDTMSIRVIRKNGTVDKLRLAALHYSLFI